MIGKLRGLVDDVDAGSVILDVNGVGYHVSCSGKTMGGLPSRGEAATLLIETHVREDEIRLFGFATAVERDAFRLLQTVQGVGTRVALGILSAMTPSDVATAVSFQEKGMFTRVSGVGPKLAERLLVELKNKVAAFGVSAASTAAELAVDQASTDAVSALTNLGYSKEQAAGAVVRVRKQDPDAGVDVLIRKGLKELAA